MNAPVLSFEAVENDALADEITLLAGQINAANHHLLKLIARFDEQRGWCGGGTVRSCAHWLNWRCGIALGAAREKVRVARSLEQLPLIDAAFAKGEVSYSKVRAMTRTATPENEDYLLMIARYGTATHVEQVVRKYKGVTEKLDVEAEQTQEGARKLVYFQDEEGNWIIHGKLPPEAGALVVKALNAIAEPIQQEQRDQKLAKNVPAGTCSVEEAAPSDSEEQLPSELEPPSVDYPQSRADALATMAEHFLATSAADGRYRGLKGAERTQVMLHVDINTLRNQSCASQAHEHCNLDDRQWLSPATARRLACDATLVTVLEDENGKVLNIGRRARAVPAAIQRALSLRDRTCRVPGCCQARNLDAHHIKHWADGGETSLDNLVHLCRYHHTQLHRGVFSIEVERSADHSAPQLVFKLASGQRLTASFFPQFPAEASANPVHHLAQHAPDVTANTAVSRWDGASCDYGTAVYALLRRDGRYES